MARTKLARTTDQPGVRTYAVAKVTPSDTRTGLEPPSLTQKKIIHQNSFLFLRISRMSAAFSPHRPRAFSCSRSRFASAVRC